MTASTSITYKIDCSYDSIPVTDSPTVVIDNKLKSLFNKIIPISNVSIDSSGNCSRLWSLSNETFLATVCDTNGNLHVINQNKIISPYSNKNISTILPKFKQLPNAKWNFHYNCVNKELIVLPHLQAGSVDDIAVQSEQTKTKKVKIGRHLFVVYKSPLINIAFSREMKSRSVFYLLHNLCLGNHS